MLWFQNMLIIMGEKERGHGTKDDIWKQKIHKHNYWENGVLLDTRKLDRENGGC